jgi:hypothetical protein
MSVSLIRYSGKKHSRVIDGGLSLWESFDEFACAVPPNTITATSPIRCERLRQLRI